VDIAFDKLIRLQYVDSEIARLLSFLDAVPARLEAIDQQIHSTAVLVVQAKEKLAANQKNRRELEGEVKAIKEGIAKYKRQLNDVKSNKEYEAINKEIAETQSRIDGIEESILNEMIAADDIEKDIKAAQKRQLDEEGHLKKDQDAVAAEKTDVEKQKAAAESERAALLPAIPADQLKLYERIHKKMGGTALSRISDDFCSICMMRVRPQLLDEIIAGTSIITCEACGRILFWEKPRDEDGPDPAPQDDPNRKDDSGPAD
jgi:predicted  nucleic acid-binding Zn-ribbon protein